MKKKRLAALAVALALVLSLSVSVLAIPLLSIGDILQIISMTDTSVYTVYSEQEWATLSPSERLSQLNYVISDQKGTSYLNENSDLINDASLSYDYYCKLTNNVSQQGVSANFGTKMKFELDGVADFGMGYYSGSGQVADILNGEFLDYIQQYPYVGQDTPSTAYKFSNGYYFNWEPLLIGDCGSSYGVGSGDNAVVHHGIVYGLRFYLHDETGKIIDIQDRKGFNSYTPLVVCDVCGGGLFDNFTITSNGLYYFDYYLWKSPHPDTYVTQKSKEYGLPWWGLYGDLVNDPVDPDTLGPKATGTDDNGNQIEFNINSDGVTYEGNTYNYNDDNSVTINGNTYYITVNPNDVNDDYYNQFLQQVINNYYNYYTTDSTPFDGTDILTALHSIFNSLENFRSNCYSQLRQTADYILDGFNAMRSSLKTIISRLKDIIDLLKDISKNVEELTEEQEEKNKSDWDDLISLFKDKVGWASLDKSMHNIQTAFFGQREYSVHSETGEIQVQILQKDAAPLASSMPNLSITYMGQSYNLYSLVSYFGSDIEPIKDFISVFLWVGFFVSLFRSIPTILGGVATFDGHSVGSNSTSKKGG